MQTSFPPEFIQTSDGRRIDRILRQCIHCGFCNAACPTYRLTGDELDSPRGRIYLIKNFFENEADQTTNTIGQKHLDRCLSCMACETSCPSGVKYGELINLGRKHINTSVKRPVLQTAKRKSILYVFTSPTRTRLLMAVARLAKPLLSPALARKIPAKIKRSNKDLQSVAVKSPANTRLLTMKGCVQSGVAPQINQATESVLKRSNIQLDESGTGCCGAMAYHLTELKRAQHTIRANIDEWYEKLGSGYENIIMNSSACSAFIKQYGTIMQDDDAYADKARHVSAHCVDLSEMAPFIRPGTSHSKGLKVAFHSPCTLQHEQRIDDVIEEKLRAAGYILVEVQDAHLCCGSAGSYSLLEKDLSSQLLSDKVHHLEKNRPDLIATANIGCLLHLQSGSDTPVKHWIELFN